MQSRTYVYWQFCMKSFRPFVNHATWIVATEKRSKQVSRSWWLPVFALPPNSKWIKTMTWHLDIFRVFQAAGGGFSGQVGPRRGAARRALAGKIQGSGAASAAGKSGGWQVLLGLVRAKVYPQLGTPGARFGWTRLKPTCAVWQRSALACEGGPGWDGEGVRGERNWTLKEEGVQENLNKKTQCFPYQKCGFNFWETSHPKIWVRYGSWYSFPWRLQKQIPQKS